MDIDHLIDMIHNILAGAGEHIDCNVEDVDIYDVLSNCGVDLSSYSAEEIMDALEYAIGSEGTNVDVAIDVNSGQSPITDNISFGASQSQIDSDIEYYERKLRQANTDIDYYSRELRRSNISNTYRVDCHNRLQQALHKASELAKKISDLKRKSAS